MSNQTEVIEKAYEKYRIKHGRYWDSESECEAAFIAGYEAALKDMAEEKYGEHAEDFFNGI